MVAVGVIWALARYPISFSELIQRVPPGRLVLGLMLIVSGKLLVIALVRQVLAASRHDHGLRFAWRAYSLADVAKYLPGGIWGIAGRLAIYRNRGIPLAGASRMLLVETAILVIFSAVVGCTLLAWQGMMRASMGGFALLALAAAALLSMRLLLPRLGWKGQITVAIGQIAAWLAFGFSFGLMASTPATDLLVPSGAFDIGFAAGTVTIFAPSGIGVRELVLGWVVQCEGWSFRSLLEVAVLHRLVWIVADFVVLVPALLFSQDGGPRQP